LAVQIQKKGLGRGLGALIPSAERAEERAGFSVEIEKIAPNPLQPRRAFDEAKIAELAASIREQGVIQPLIVRRNGNEYELIAGERRLRAAHQAGLKEVPVVVREATDHDSLKLALIENLQREDLNAIDEAQAYQRLHNEFGLSQEEIAERMGKSRPAVANSLRLLGLPGEVQQAVAAGKLPAGQARALLGLGNDPSIIAAARDAIAKGLSARATERLVARLRLGRKKRNTAPSDADLRALVEQLQRSLGTKVRLVPARGGGRGKIEIEYYSATDLDRLVQLLANR
jgi:ParB family transcriptional regulator, chromosome partitioning protein